MGLAILGERRLMNRFSVESTPGSGTSVVLEKTLSPRFSGLNTRDLNELLSSIESRSA